MVRTLITRIITSPVIIYTTRCFIGFYIGYLLFLKYPNYEILWTLISIMLVISPEGQNSKKLSVERFKSNLVGSAVGLVCLEIHPNPDFLISLLGVFLTIMTCYLFKILNMARVALVALIIILVQPHTASSVEATPLFRCLAVTLGCVIGLTITVLTSMIIRRLKRYYGIPLS
ncbi:FUSC family protein [Myroides odoratimimus]|uniref:FUSC family protein n=1 Tax=Myroides odoratimimus TaxID=76832 RepID=UPI002576A574|nr:FUSC family protein [Myroides odoratimimus]MDM1395858.1 FUSC family protein [Myroides odoratimimus]MDM1528183.1 FUSC family protein [Myroides odoratimimus]